MIEVIAWLASICGVSFAQMAGFLGITFSGMLIPAILDVVNNSKKRGVDNKFAVKNDIKHLLESDGMQLSRNIFLSARNLYEHIVIFGPTGSGKSATIFLPNLLQKESFLNGNSSLLITDLKGELYKVTANFQREIGRKIKVFAPYNGAAATIHYNPLDFCRSEGDIISLAKDILTVGAKSIELRNGSSNGSSKDSVWINMASPLLASILLYVNQLGKPHNTVSNALRLLLYKSSRDLEEMLLSSSNDNVKLQYLIYQKAISSDATSGSIQVTLTANVQSFLSPEIESFTSYSDFDFEEIRKNPTAFYLIFPPNRVADLAPITSLFFNQFFSSAIESNIEQPLPTFCLFDEFANAGQIPNFNMYASILRSYKIGLVCCLQDKNQLKNIYGFNAETIFNNLKNLVMFGGEKDFETLKSIESLCGATEIINISTTTNAKGNITTTKNFKTRSLMPASELKNISEDEILIMLKNSRPLLDLTNPYYKSSKYMNNTI